MNNKTEILVTSYKNPDLDGVASAISYSEFLCKIRHKALPAIFDKPHQEASFVLGKFGITLPIDGSRLVDEIDKIVIVDVSDMRGLSEKVPIEKVVEIIDHRQIHEAHKFPNAKVQIELVGASATLVAERFRNNHIEPSYQSAVLLFSAISSHTINFRSNITTQRDRDIAKWLDQKFSFPPNLIHEMFVDKSRFKAPLKETILMDLAIYQFGKYSLGIGQLEIIEVETFVESNLVDLERIFEEIKGERNLEIVFLTCVDLEKACNTIVSFDTLTQKLLGKALGVNFENGSAKTSEILMRKEIAPLIKDYVKALN